MEDQALGQIEEAVREAWSGEDPRAKVTARPRGPFVDLRVVSMLFEGRESSEREAMLWLTLRALPPELLARMTYSLLLTPDEEATFFPQGDETSESHSPPRKDHT